ncbi:MAG: winged helix-turn-helix transcriptional regulator [Gammaproteobacteria bacterium]|nr:winged helix-turn-helix transcriptional regulator [Gammaproteobacteria bacterium]
MRNYLLLKDVFSALADPTRRLIIELLCEGDAPVLYIAESLPLSLGRVTRHLQALERAGLIRSHKIGRVRTCWLEPEGLDLLDHWVNEQRNRWQRSQVRR